MAGEFERWDGEKTDLDICHCPKCKNYFWVPTEHAAIELPAFCCWCGFRFDGHIQIGGPESNEKIP